jgi:hypothetical protein
MVAGDRAERGSSIQLVRDTPEFIDLGRVASPVDEIAGYHDKRRLHSIGGGDREFEVGGFLREILIAGVHSKLRIGHLQERQSFLATA